MCLCTDVAEKWFCTNKSPVERPYNVSVELSPCYKQMFDPRQATKPCEKRTIPSGSFDGKN